MKYIVLLLLLVGFISSVQSQENGSAETETVTTETVIIHQPEAIRWLIKVEKKHQTIQRIIAEFKQTKTSNLFLEKIESEGLLYHTKPDLLKIEYLPPNELHNWIVNDKIYIYSPEIEQGDIYNLSKQEAQQRRINKMLLGFGTSVEDLKSYFQIGQFPVDNTEEIGIIFIPLADSQSHLFQSCRLWLNKDRLEPVQFKILDDQEDETHIEIKKISWNAAIEGSVYERNVPKNVEWIERD